MDDYDSGMDVEYGDYESSYDPSTDGAVWSDYESSYDPSTDGAVGSDYQSSYDPSTDGMYGFDFGGGTVPLSEIREGSSSQIDIDSSGNLVFTNPDGTKVTYTPDQVVQTADPSGRNVFYHTTDGRDYVVDYSSLKPGALVETYSQASGGAGPTDYWAYHGTGPNAYSVNYKDVYGQNPSVYTYNNGQTTLYQDGKTLTGPTNPPGTTGTGGGSSTDWMKMLMPLLLLAMMNRGGSSSTTQTVIPNLTASRDVLPYDSSRRPGSAPQRYLSDVKYMAEGGLASLFGGSPPRAMDWWRDMRAMRQDSGPNAPRGGGQGLGGGDADGSYTPAEQAAPVAAKPEVRTQPVPGGISTLPIISQPAPYSQPSGRRPGSAPIDYGVSGFAKGGGISRLLKGPGDGTSDDIKATIDGERPARLATGEFVVDARTVSELGNGSTEAGAAKLNKMVERVHNTRKRAKRGKDSKADRHLPA